MRTFFIPEMQLFAWHLVACGAMCAFGTICAKYFAT